MAQALEPQAHALGFGPTQLAALMRDFAPPAAEDEPARHTVTVGGSAGATADAAGAMAGGAGTDAGGATATVVDPPRAASPRRARFALAAALGAAAGFGTFLAWPRHVEELAPPPRPAQPAPATPQPVATKIAKPPVADAPSKPAIAHKPQSKRPTPPDLVDGKLLNPFKR